MWCIPMHPTVLAAMILNTLSLVIKKKKTFRMRMVLWGGLSLPHMVWVFNESLEGGSSNCLKAQSHSYLAID